MNTFLRLRTVAAVVLFLTLLIGCEETRDGSGDGPGEAARGGNYEQVTAAFAKALDAGDYASAYAMTSKHVRDKMIADAFAKSHVDARAKYGKPLKHTVSLSEDDREILEGEDFDDSEIPARDRLAWMNIQWALEVDDDGDVDRCYETWVMIVEEDGQNKIGSTEYSWCD